MAAKLPVVSLCDVSLTQRGGGGRWEARDPHEVVVQHQAASPSGFVKAGAARCVAPSFSLCPAVLPLLPVVVGGRLLNFDLTTFFRREERTGVARRLTCAHPEARLRTE